MTPENFVYWLQGFLEISNEQTLDCRQTNIIRDHLNLVFEKKTQTKESINKLPKILSQNNEDGAISIPNNSNNTCSTPIDLSHTRIHVTC